MPNVVSNRFLLPRSLAASCAINLLIRLVSEKRGQSLIRVFFASGANLTHLLVKRYLPNPIRY